MRRFLVRASALAAALSLSLAASAQVKWDLASGYPLSNPHTVTLQQFAKDVDIASGGKVRLTVHPNGSLYKAPEIMRAVESGQTQAGEVLMSVLVNQNPVYGLDSLPFLATGFDEAQRLWVAQRPVLERLLAKRGVKLLYAVAWPPQGIYAKRELRSAADMKGLKWRAYNPATTKIAQVVGAQPLTIQAAELSQALATGVVDSTMTSGATGVDSKIWESLSHYHTVNAWLPKNMVVVNARDFDRLSASDQKAMLAAAAEAERKGWDRMRAFNDESLAILRKNKMTVVAPAPQLTADMKKIGDEMLADWAKAAGADGQEILKAYQAPQPAARK